MRTPSQCRIRASKILDATKCRDEKLGVSVERNLKAKGPFVLASCSALEAEALSDAKRVCYCSLVSESRLVLRNKCNRTSPSDEDGDRD